MVDSLNKRSPEHVRIDNYSELCGDDFDIEPNCDTNSKGNLILKMILYHQDLTMLYV